MAKLYSLCFVFLVFGNALSQNFQDGDGGQVKWASNCDFKGFDIGSVQGPAEQCGSNCLSNSRCTHFTWYLNVCYIKNANKPPVSNLNGGVCGYVVSRNGGGGGGGGQTLDRNSRDYQILWKTIYAEARGEPEIGQRAVAWVILNRTKLNRSYWGGNTIAGVCLAPYQFECWNGKSDIIMSETAARDAIDRWLPSVFQGSDPSQGSAYYNNPDKEGYPDWTTRVVRSVKIGNHQFYKDP